MVSCQHEGMGADGRVNHRSLHEIASGSRIESWPHDSGTTPTSVQVDDRRSPSRHAQKRGVQVFRCAPAATDHPPTPPTNTTTPNISLTDENETSTGDGLTSRSAPAPVEYESIPRETGLANLVTLTPRQKSPSASRIRQQVRGASKRNGSRRIYESPKGARGLRASSAASRPYRPDCTPPHPTPIRLLIQKGSRRRSGLPHQTGRGPRATGHDPPPTSSQLHRGSGRREPNSPTDALLVTSLPNRLSTPCPGARLRGDRHPTNLETVRLSTIDGTWTSARCGTTRNQPTTSYISRSTSTRTDGAYYTKRTSPYIARNTNHPHSRQADRGPHRPTRHPLRLLQENPDRYIYPRCRRAWSYLPLMSRPLGDVSKRGGWNGRR